MTPPTAPPTSLFRHADFVRFWTAQTVAQFGSQVSVLAIPLVAIVVLGSSAFEVALLSTIEFLPFVFFALPAGVWIDRLRRRPILIGADVGRAALLATIPLAYALGVLTIGQLYAVGFFVGTLTVFFDIAYQAYLPSLVDRDRILDGNAKLETSRSVAQTAGPAIAGWLIGVLTAPIAIIVNSVTFLASAAALLAIRRHEPAPGADDRVGADERVGATPAATGLRREIAAGLRYVAANPYLRSIAVTMAWANLFGQIVFSLYLLYGVRDLGLDAATLGVVLAIGNIGLIAGAVSASWFARRLGLGRAITLSLVVAGPSILLIPLAPPDAAIPFLIVSGMLVGWSVLVFNVNQVSFRQAITPVHLQGRMNATMKFIAAATIPAGSIIGGVLATALGLREAILIGAIGGSFAFLPALFSPVWRLRGIEDVPDRPGGPRAAGTMPGATLGILEPTFGGAEAPPKRSKAVVDDRASGSGGD